MGFGYQTDDRNIIDYKLWVLPDVPEMLRGPRRWSGRKPFLTFLGAAQTFGRFVEHPFPEIVSGVLGADHINFGSAGAGPEYYLKKSATVEYVNRSALCVIQVMSGRSVSTSLLESIGGGGMLKFRDGPRAGTNAMAADAYRILVREYGTDSASRQLAEARQRWISCYNELFDKITVPIALLWMSSRSPDTSADPDAQGNLGEFPHLIGSNELGAIRREGVHLIECVLKQPTYMRLTNFVTGEPEFVYSLDRFPGHPDWARDVNNYYYVQRQHDEAASAIIRACLVGNNGPLRTAAASAGG
jgi:hypothetical protein